MGQLGLVPTINTQPGGTKAALNVTAAGVIKAAPGTIMRIHTTTVGTGGALTINDTTTVGGAAAGNQVASFAFGNANVAAGAVVTLEVPCANGIVISAVPTGGWVGTVTYF